MDQTVLGAADALPDSLNVVSNPFEALSRRAERQNAINLGQGLPEFGWTDDLLDAAVSALRNQSNQYPPSAGLPALRSAVAAHYTRFQGINYQSDEVVVTSGGTEALAAALFALIRPGDEVILVEPFYGAYMPLIEQAGGIARTARLNPPDFALSYEALAAVVTPRTRLLVFNNPLNPFGVVLENSVLEAVAAICRDHDLVAVSDEVWEHARSPRQDFRSLASLPGMRQRTVKIGAGGKIFSLTGWKVGWTCAPRHLSTAIERLHLNLTFATPPHLQLAFVHGLNQPDTYFEARRRERQCAADQLFAGLNKAGFCVLPSAATHFLVIDLKASGTSADDTVFCDRLLAEAGVAAMAVSPFYLADAPTRFVRLCFMKRPETIVSALRGLEHILKVFRKEAPLKVPPPVAPRFRYEPSQKAKSVENGSG